MIPTLSGGWKADVFICQDHAELERAYEFIQSPQVVLQKYIDKVNEYCLGGFSINQGKDSHFSISIIYNYFLKDYYSLYLIVGSAYNEFINNTVASILKEIGFEGIFEIDLLIDQDGTIYFDEINFRNSPWRYLSAALGRCLPEMWMKAMLENKIDYDLLAVQEHYTAIIEPVDYSSISWELIQLSGYFSDKVFMTATFMAEKSTKTYYMCKLCDISGNYGVQGTSQDIYNLLNNESVKSV